MLARVYGVAMHKDLHAGAKLFNAGEWWEAHEAWEPYWLSATDLQRHYIQGLILLAAALHKRWEHGSLSARNFYKAQKHLSLLPPIYDNLDLPKLQNEVWLALQAEQRPSQEQLPNIFVE